MQYRRIDHIYNLPDLGCAAERVSLDFPSGMHYIAGIVPPGTGSGKEVDMAGKAAHFF